MADRYEYLVLPVSTMRENYEEIEKAINQRGAEGWELMTVSFERGVALFEKRHYVERRSEEHIDTVLKAVKSYDDVKDLEFLLDKRGNDSDEPAPVVLSDDDAWRFLIDRILGES